MKALILAGGSGTRFWPLSRRSRPKQLLPLAAGDRTLLAATLDRLDGLVGAGDRWICTTRDLVSAVSAAAPTVPAPQVLGEPEGRNTAPAIAWAVRNIGGLEPVVVLPADHRVEDEAAFRAALEVAGRAAEQGQIVTLGVRPTFPETGFGYLEVSPEPLSSGVGRVVRFVEKPDRATAERFLAAGNYLWNAGIFVFRPDVLAAAIATHLPALDLGLAAIERDSTRRDAVWRELPAVSIDHGLMEKLSDIVVVPFDGGWSDLGSWDALYPLLPTDERGNAIQGDGHVVAGGSGTLVWAEPGIAVTCVGVDDLVVVATGDAVLVVPRSRCQDVRAAVAALAAAGHRDKL